MINPGLYLAIHEISHHFDVDATVIHCLINVEP